MHSVWQRLYNGTQGDGSHARAHGRAAIRVLSVRESLLGWKRAEAAHAQPLRGETVPLPDLSQDLHLSEPPKEAPEEPFEHDVRPPGRLEHNLRTSGVRLQLAATLLKLQWTH